MMREADAGVRKEGGTSGISGVGGVSRTSEEGANLASGDSRVERGETKAGEMLEVREMEFLSWTDTVGVATLRVDVTSGSALPVSNISCATSCPEDFSIRDTFSRLSSWEGRVLSRGVAS